MKPFPFGYALTLTNFHCQVCLLPKRWFGQKFWQNPCPTKQKGYFWLTCVFAYLPFKSQKWPTSIFSWQYPYIVKIYGYENWQNDYQRENALIFEQILSTHSLTKCMETNLENLFVDIGTWRVKWICRTHFGSSTLLVLRWWMTKRFNNLIVETQAIAQNRLHSVPRILAEPSRAKRAQQRTLGKKIWWLTHPRNFVSEKIVRTSTPSCKPGWNFAFQAPARFGGKSHSFPTF